jgi:hypothetical protein
MRFGAEWLVVAGFLGSVAGAQQPPAALSATAGPPEPRVALVIGNEQYSNWSKLPEVADQSREMAHSLEVLGFKVYHDGALLNQNHEQMKSAFQDFAGQVPDGALVWIFYSGHGAENYLIPVDAPSDAGKTGSYSLCCVWLKSVFDELRGSKPKAMVIVIDACRDPSVASSSGATQPPAAPADSLLAFSTEPGNFALGDNDPYTPSLLVHMAEQGRAVDEIFNTVDNEVAKESNRIQNPQHYLSTFSRDPIYLIPPDVIDDWNFNDVDTPKFRTANPNFRLAEPYLEKHGIHAEHVTDGTEMSFVYYAVPYSGTSLTGRNANIFRQDGPTCNLTHTVGFSLKFSRPVKQFAFSRALLLAESENGITHPAWDASAYGVDGKSIDQKSRVGEDLIAYLPTPPATTGEYPEREFVMTGPNIQGVAFTGSGWSGGKPFAAFCSVQITEMKITIGPTVIRDDRGTLQSIIW